MMSVANGSKLNSICDEWNVLAEHNTAFPEYAFFKTIKYRLTTDTLIAGQHYIQLQQDEAYIGAMREGENATIYYIPADSTREYLLYAFNSCVGDVLENVWFGVDYSQQIIVRSTTVMEIKSTTPKIIKLDIEYAVTYQNAPEEVRHEQRQWIDGVGFDSATDGAPGILPPAGTYISSLLCAYKNGEQIYISSKGEQYGCEYSSEEAIESILCPNSSVRKILHNGQLLIERDDKTYNAQGAEVR